MSNDHFAPFIKERNALEDSHFWGKCSQQCKHDYYAKMCGHSWEAQPPELRALGRDGAKRVLLRIQAKVFAEMEADIVQEREKWEAHQAKRAKMTPEELAADDKRLEWKADEAHEYLEKIIMSVETAEGQAVP